MASKEGSTGLLARMARMLRAPAAEQGDAAESVQARNSEFDKLEAQARIASKRRDDMVRRREFDHLRKVRAQGRGAASMARPSVFQNSSSFRTEDVLPEARARTISKIDAIEAHMSQSWGPERRSAPRFAGPIAPPAPKNPHAAPPPRLTNVVAARPGPSVAKSAPAPTQDDDLDLDFTEMLSASAPLTADGAPTVSPGIEAELPPLDAGDSGGTDSAPQPRTQRPVLLDLEAPALQEAAIRFAEGEYEAAAAILQTAIQDPQADPALVDNCMCALLDVYRASDSPQQFDEVAIAYAQSFGRSAPEWYSVSDMLSAQATEFAALADAAGANAAAWACPADLNAAAVAQLAAWQAGSSERHVHWDALRSIAPDCVVALTAVFTHWAAQPLSLTFGGSDVLNVVLLAATPEADRTVDPAWWHLRLEALRIQGEQEAYENVALDYCLIYEVSPPSWLESNSTYSVDEDANATRPSRLGPDTEAQGLTDVQVPEVLELRGFLLRDATDAMAQLRSQVPQGLPLVIQCARLVRVDFAAGGSILNWLVAVQDTGLQVRFIQVPRLVAALLHVMGITEHADLSVLKN
jgi:ABC-type transporter Mla MlaB component